MTDTEPDEKELAEKWGTVTEITSLGSARVTFDEGGETSILQLWTKYLSQFDHDTLTVGTRREVISPPAAAIEFVLFRLFFAAGIVARMERNTEGGSTERSEAWLAAKRQGHGRREARQRFMP